VVVVAGETDVEPDASGVTAPTPWSIESDVALLLVQDSVLEPPAVIEVGLAESVTLGAVGAPCDKAVRLPAAS
jgi:hypothetical protein